MMGQAPELSGPDLAAGIEMSRLPENLPILGHARGEAVILVRKGSLVHALGATCSHYSGPLAEGLVVGDTVRCPWHHACFDLRTGRAVRPPALHSVPCYEVAERHGKVFVTGRRSAPVPSPGRSKGPESVLIVGGGAAGDSAAATLRRE